MDGAWALYEAWVKIQTGEAESALIYSFGKTSPGDLAEVLALQLDPYCVTQLWPDADSVAGIQARLYLERARKTRARSRRGRGAQPPRRARQSARGREGRLRRRQAARRAVPHLAAARPRLPDQQRRRHGDRDRGGRSRAQAREAPGLDPRHRPPHRPARARRARPHARAVGRARGEEGRRRRRPDRLRRARRALHAPGADPARGARPRRRRADQPVGRLAVHAHAVLVRTEPDRRRVRAHRARRGRSRGGARARRATACSRTSCACWRGSRRWPSCAA